MIRTYERKAFTGELLLCRYFGNSGDSKPTTGIVTGSSFKEVDTGIEYLYDEVSGGWIAQNTGNGKTSIAGATVTLGSALTYNGSEQTQGVSTVKIGSTTLTASTDYEIINNKGTDAGTYVLRIVGKGDYVGYVDKEFTVAKANGSVTASPDELSLTEDGDAGTSTITVTGDGEISIATSDADVATVALDDDTVTVTPVGAGSATVTITLAASDNYNGSSDTISVTVAAAETPDDNNGDG